MFDVTSCPGIVPVPSDAMGGEDKRAMNDVQVLIDIDGMQAVFALAGAGGAIDQQSICRYATSDFPTATDCVQRFAQDAGIRLAGSRCAISISGIVHGDAIRIARCPWIVSARGFGYLFQNDVLVLNDSAAKLWAATDFGATRYRPLGAYGPPDFAREGRWLGINFDTGLGAALLVGQADGRLCHVATEAGHTAFTPVNEAERELAARIGGGGKPLSWERALFDRLDNPDRAGTAGGDKMQPVAEILGSLVGDLILATGAWDGVLLFGKAASLLEKAGLQAAYAKRVEVRANFQLQLRSVPQWGATVANINLVGAARFLQARLSAA